MTKSAKVDKATRQEVPPRKGGFSTLVHNKADTYVPPSGPSMKQRGQG